MNPAPKMPIISFDDDGWMNIYSSTTELCDTLAQGWIEEVKLVCDAEAREIELSASENNVLV